MQYSQMYFQMQTIRQQNEAYGLRHKSAICSGASTSGCRGDIGIIVCDARLRRLHSFHKHQSGLWVGLQLRESGPPRFPRSLSLMWRPGGLRFHHHGVPRDANADADRRDCRDDRRDRRQTRSPVGRRDRSAARMVPPAPCSRLSSSSETHPDGSRRSSDRQDARASSTSRVSDRRLT
jgi:hypothetical protein